MRQTFLKASFDVGWGSSEYRVALGGQGASTNFTNSSDQAKVVIPLAGIFSNLNVYSPVGSHPNYIFTMVVNGVATALTCTLAPAASQAKDIIHSVSVVAGDDVYFTVIVSPPSAGSGYPVCFSVEFEGVQQFYSVTPIIGSIGVGNDQVGGALGNGNLQSFSSTLSLSNTYSICSTPGILTGLRMKTYGTLPDAGVWTGYITKNQVVQNGSGGTVNTACVLTGAGAQATSTFSLPIAVGDHLDFALIRTVSGAAFALAQVAMSVTFNPTDTKSFMCCGGSNNVNDIVNTEYRWVHSIQQMLTESIVQCPVGPRGLKVTGLRTECHAPAVGRNVTYTIRKNGVDTAATVIVTDTSTSAVIGSLNIPFVDGDLISLKAVPFNSPSLGNGMWWGLSLTELKPDLSGIYFVAESTKTHDVYYNDEKKIPDPTIKTGFLGE